MSLWHRYLSRTSVLGTAVIALGFCLPAIAAPTLAESAATPQPVPQSTPQPATPVSSEQVTPTSTEAIAILSPVQSAVLDQPATALTIQYPVGTSVEVFVNEQAADKGLIGRTETNQTTGRITETWYGIILNQGKNTITVHRKGEAQPSAKAEVQVSGQPTQIKVSTQETRIPADGRSTATVLGELQDAAGNLSNWSADVTLDTNGGEFLGVDEAPATPGFQVKVNRGKFTAKLRSTTQAQAVRIRAQSGGLEGYYQFQFETPRRDELLSTGVVSFRLGARGTNFFDRYQDFLPVDRNNKTVLDVKGAAFATTSVGEWLFTGAFNSARSLNETADGRASLFGSLQTADQQYPNYGDDSTTEKVTPSQDSLFLRLERTSRIKNAGFDYVMWGDFNTEEFATPSQEFTATSRSLHGLKANYNWGNLQLSGLYSNTVQGFQRDTIAPDGTVGFYFVSRRNLVEGSENVIIELEELNRPGTVVAAQQLVRGADYTFDYDRGSLLFREPILRTDVAADGTILVRRIVVTYQYEAQGQNTSVWGARARYHFSRTQGKESWVGGTYWREDQGTRNFELWGADAKIALGKKGSIIAEYAHSMNQSETAGDRVSGSAYRIVAQGTLFKGLNAQAFYRTAEAGFANNATLSFVPGQTRYGLSLTGQVAPKTRLTFQADHEDNFGIAPQILSDLDLLLNPGSRPTPGSRQDNSLTTISAGLNQRIGKAIVGLKFIHRDRIDRTASTNQTVDQRNVSNQLEGTFSIPLRDKLTFNSLAAINLSGNDPIYTNRVQAGLAWEVHPNVTIRLSEHYLWGGQYGSRALTTLDTVAKYDLTKDTQLTGRFSLLGGLDSMTGQGAAGIKHRWVIAPGLKLDVAYEYVMGQFFGKTGAGQQFQQPYAVGDGASALSLDSGHNFAVGLDYTNNPNLKASFRYQYRTSAAGVNSALTAEVAGKLTNSLTGLVRYEQAGAANQMLGLLGDTANLKVGLAYRNPKNDKFNALLRYEFRHNPAITPETLLLGSGTGSTDHTLSIEGIYAPNWRWELYGKLAYRHSSSYLANDFVGSSDLLLSQLRATYRLGYRWDASVEGRVINTLSTGSQEYGATAEVGYYLTPNLRLAAGYALGSVSDRDLSNSRSASGPYLGVTVKLDQLFDSFKFLKKKPKPDTPKPAKETSATVSEPTVQPAPATEEQGKTQP
ncbi:MAG: TonB-dependent receptor [Thermosynechococcaceae cyanobacterium MS004]|nr:TonB-dependent receptor [Thermosynechococcaceae cyanobacterium MS004]